MNIPPRHLFTTFVVAAMVAVSVITLHDQSLPRQFPPPVPWSEALGLKLGVSVVLLAAIAWRAPNTPGATSGPMTLVLLVAAGAMTVCHWFMVDRQPVATEWQRGLYVQLLNHTSGPPHQYRALPYGFVRLLESVTHDWYLSCLAYRWFFNFWLLWAWHRFACLFHTPGRAALTLLPFAVLYPFSIAYYLGQLTDPLSHTLFVLGFIYIMEDRPIALAIALALGMLGKETAVLLVPCYAICWLARGPSRPKAGAMWIAILGVVATAAFLAARVPFGWRPGAKEMNEVGLMIGTNLGIGEPVAVTGVPLVMNYLHPLLFVVPFVPWIAWHWREIDVRLRLLALTLTPLLLASNLCFGWLYESRNYVPLLPLLTTMALPRVGPASRAGPEDAPLGSRGLP